MSKLQSLFDEIVKVIRKHDYGLINLVIGLATVALNQIIEVSAFQCPCITKAELIRTCTPVMNQTNTTCIHYLNASYGWMYIFAPALILFIVGLAAHLQIWQMCTGCGSHESNVANGGGATRRCPCNCCATDNVCCTSKCCATVIGRASIAPVVWVGIALLDGDSFACATTPLPYRFSVTPKETCDDIERLSMTADYYTQRGVSQIAGWSVLVASFVVGISIYCVVRCCYKKTYYHAKYSNFYRDCEMEEFDKSMKDQIKSEVSETNFPEPKSITTPQWNKIAFLLNKDDDKEKNMDGDLMKQLLKTAVDRVSTDDSSQASTSNLRRKEEDETAQTSV